MFSKLTKYALAPFWAAQLLTGAKSFIDNPILGDARLNALGLHVTRQKLAHSLAARRRQALARDIMPAHAAAFERNGFVMIQGFLPADEFTRMLAEARSYRGAAREMVQGDTITRRLALTPSALTAMPALQRALRLPLWRNLLNYVGSHKAAPVCYLQTILAGAANGPPDPQTHLHADTFQPTVKAWLTLTDVPPDGGPFMYVPGSHKLNAKRLAWERRMSMQAASRDRLSGRGSFRVTEDELAGMGYGRPQTFAVPANTLIVADTSGFHARGPSVGATQRVEIWAYGRNNPFLSPPVDVWGVEALGQRRAPLFWAFGDVIERLGGKRQGWRVKQGTSAFDR